MLTDEEMLKLIDGVWLVNEPRGEPPKDMWTDNFGWVLKDGEPTDTTIAYVAWLVENGYDPVIRKSYELLKKAGNA